MPLYTYRKKEKGETNFTVDEAYTIASAVSKTIDEIFLHKSNYLGNKSTFC